MNKTGGVVDGFSSPEYAAYSFCARNKSEYHRILYVAAFYNIQIPLALHVLPALLASIAKEQGRVQLHSVFMSTQGELVTVPKRSPCKISLAKEVLPANTADVSRWE